MPTHNPVVTLKRGRDRSVLRRHPWLFSGAVARIEGEPADGDVVEVEDAKGNWLARGYLNSHSQIIVRLLTWDRDRKIDPLFWRERLQRSVARRADLACDPRITAYRLAHAESDGLPGLVVDRYGGYLVVQLLTLGMDRRREQIADALQALVGPDGIYERSDVEVRALEGLEPQVGLLRGEEPPRSLQVLESGHHFVVDLQAGQKTGFYLDQRENRARLAPFCARREVLDAFAYTGSFGLYAVSAGAARVTFVETSAQALEGARQNLALNGHDPQEQEFVEGSVFEVLRTFRAEHRTFDVIVLDPPKFAPTSKHVRRASRAYKDINLLAFQLLRAGGVLLSTSCSGAVSADLFQKILFGAALDAERDAQIIGYLHQAADHPVALTFPEGAYLKGLICRVS